MANVYLGGANMAVKQISVFVENKQGRLLKVTQCLAEHGVNIHALSAADTADFGILRLIVDKAEVAQQALKEAGFTVIINEVLVIKVADRPGGLNEALQVLTADGCNVDYIYAFYNSDQATALNIIKVDDMEKAAAALQKAGVMLLENKDFCC